LHQVEALDSQPPHVKEPLVAFVVTTVAFTIDSLMGTHSDFATSLVALVVLLPGLMFTVALTELSTRHLASGTARLSGQRGHDARARIFWSRGD
jgi:uncharacterized membrane protein YjjP (DUF1212 family)